MTKRNNHASFLERVDADALKKERSKIRSSPAHGQDPECTFKPALTKKAAAAKPRSCAAMSRDSLHTTEINAKIENLGSSGGTIATSADELFDAVVVDASATFVAAPADAALGIAPGAAAEFEFDVGDILSTLSVASAQQTS